MKAFIICGYGIPEDIRKDQNYLTYLHVAFNRMYAEAKNEKALVIPCGGPTSCTPPYKGTEAEKIAEYLKYLMERENVGRAASAWSLLLEDQSLSSLENLIFAERIIHRYEGEEVMIFCEATRVERNKETAQHLFKEKKVAVEGIDFDISKNRYLSDDIVEKKEQAEREHAQWALQSVENMRKHHELFEEKYKLLRKWESEGMPHVDAVTRWYKEGPELYEQMKKNPNS